MISRTLSHYRILKELGKGGMGEVYLAHDTNLDRYVALKILPADFVLDKDRMKRFIREAKAASAISHSNVAHIYEIGESDHIHFIAMEYIEGETLADRMQRSALSLSEIIRVAKQLADSLQEAHAKGIIHRDIKPSNIMLTSRDNVKLLDFGLAKVSFTEGIDVASQLSTATGTQLGTALGTLPYMSPEQLLGRNVDQRTDFFSLGVLLYQLTTTQLPFHGNSAVELADAILHKECISPHQLNLNIPRQFCNMILKMLAKKPDERYQNAGELLIDLEKLQELKPESVPISRILRRPAIFIPVIVLILALVGMGLWMFQRYQNTRWAREQALPEILQLVDQARYSEAFAIAVKAEKFIKDDPVFKRQWPNISRTITIRTNPAGADVFMKEYEALDNNWQHVGQTPLEKFRVARGFFRWKISKAGFGTSIRAEPQNWYEDQVQVSLTLDPENRIPSGMVRVSGGKLESSRLVLLKPVELEDYWMDQFEVSNQRFKKFVDAGGYQKRQYWKFPFIKNGHELSWREAMQEFHDTTGRPGPAGWELGDYPKGEDHLPVTGVSWFEAAAYAEFNGTHLPSLYHWFYAAGVPLSFEIIPMSNFKGRGPHPVGTDRSLSPFGTFDMAGNVKEWCWNETGSKERYILGGGYNEQEYLFYQPDKRSPFQRENNLGFRCITYISQPSTSAVFLQPVEGTRRDFEKEKPVSDDAFKIIKNFYSYKKTDLNARIESTNKKEQFWRKETVTFDAAYGNERVIAHVFLPKQGAEPYQTVIFFPGFWARDTLSSQNIEKSLDFSFVDFVVRSGRAVVYPVYKGTYERGGGPSMQDLNADQTRDWTIQYIKDVSRTIDYVETRHEVDPKKLAFYGYSWGARVGTIVGAIEDRFPVMILAHGGFHSYVKSPEIEELNFASRVKIPVLMINGRYDHVFPVEFSQKPFFQFLGTPPEHKSHLIFDGGHSSPRNELIKAVLGWLDRYLGPVSHSSQPM